MGAQGGRINLVFAALIAIVGGEAQVVGRQVGEGLVDGVCMKEQGVPDLEIGGMPYGLFFVYGHTPTADRAWMTDVMLNKTLVLTPGPDG